MKNVLLLLALTSFQFLLAQQKVIFNNTSSYDVDVSYIITTLLSDMDGTSSEQLDSDVSGNAALTVLSGTTFQAEESNPINPNRFPFNEFQGINSWRYGSSIISSTVAYMNHGPRQKFYFAKVATKNGPSPVVDGGNIGQNFGASSNYINGTNVDFYFFVNYPDPNDLTRIEYTIFIQ